MKIVRAWILFCLTLAACSSSEPAQSACTDVSCSDAQGPWCCPFLSTCAPTHGLCDAGCPTALPVKCGTTANADLCCPAGDTCGPNDTCVPPGGLGGSGAGGSGGGVSTAGTGGVATGGAGGHPAQCVTSKDCPGSAPCCNLVGDCSSTETTCTCKTGAECSSGACAPYEVTASGSGFLDSYVCVPNDGQPYHGCATFSVSCGTGYCCFTDSLENQFCAKPCTTAADCGSVLASCNTYSSAHTTCSGTMACGPSQ
jgi:hypothetical protein